jgi:serine/threonine protein kinase
LQKWFEISDDGLGFILGFCFERISKNEFFLHSFARFHSHSVYGRGIIIASGSHSVYGRNIIIAPLGVRLYRHCQCFSISESTESSLEVREIGAFLLLVLHDLHQIRVLHGDIKPFNIIRCSKREKKLRDRCCLIDFGHAKIAGSNGWPIDIEVPHGTLASMSTGAMDGQPLTPLDDL